MTYNDIIENGESTISNINISIDDNGDKYIGKDYSISPEIYFIDHYNNKIYKDVVFSNITALGSLDTNFTIDSNFQ